MAEIPQPATGSVTERLRCFVIGPIGNKHDPVGSDGKTVYEEAVEVWEDVIEPACETVGLAPVRADGLLRAGEITDQIFRRLRDDDVVIADVTGANANVMYELGLRHSRDLLTVQIGEYGRLPFDLTVIRTVLFSRSPRGLINARNELTEILKTGLAGQYDPVSSTRVWSETESPPAETEGASDSTAPDESPEREDPAGFLDLVAEGEARQPEFIAATEAINGEIVALGELAERATDDMEKSDAREGGMRGRLTVAARFASGLDQIAERLEQHVTNYEDAMAAVSAANLAIIERIEEDPDQLEEVRDYGMVTRGLAQTARSSLESLSGMSSSMQANARLSRVLRAPTRRVTSAIEQFATSTERIDEWDRRLQALGIPLPADESIPEAGEPTQGQESDEEREGSVEDDDSRGPSDE